LASIPDQPPPSSRLVRCRKPLVQPKLAGKCLNTIHLARASVVEPKPMATPETSHAAPCAPLASIPDQPPPSSCLVRRRMPLVQPKLAGKCLNTIYLARANVVEPKPMATPETSHAAAIDPLTPQPSQPTPSPRLRQRRVRLVLMKFNGKCPIFDAFGQVILKSFFKLALLPSRVLRNESSLHVWGTLT